MKTLVINESDVGGGAAMAANRICQSLRCVGVDSKMLVQNKFGDSKLNYGLIYDFYSIYSTHSEITSRLYPRSVSSRILILLCSSTL